MKFYTTTEDAKYELEIYPNYKTGETSCNCGKTWYYEKPVCNDLVNKIIVCNSCYIECENIRRY